MFGKVNGLPPYCENAESIFCTGLPRHPNSTTYLVPSTRYQVLARYLVPGTRYLEGAGGVKQAARGAGEREGEEGRVQAR